MPSALSGLPGHPRPNSRLLASAAARQPGFAFADGGSESDLEEDQLLFGSDGEEPLAFPDVFGAGGLLADVPPPPPPPIGAARGPGQTPLAADAAAQPSAAATLRLLRAAYEAGYGRPTRSHDRQWLLRQVALLEWEGEVETEESDGDKEEDAPPTAPPPQFASMYASAAAAAARAPQPLASFPASSVLGPRSSGKRSVKPSRHLLPAPEEEGALGPPRAPRPPARPPPAAAHPSPDSAAARLGLAAAEARAAAARAQATVNEARRKQQELLAELRLGPAAGGAATGGAAAGGAAALSHLPPPPPPLTVGGGRPPRAKRPRAHNDDFVFGSDAEAEAEAGAARAPRRARTAAAPRPGRRPGAAGGAAGGAAADPWRICDPLFGGLSALPGAPLPLREPGEAGEAGAGEDEELFAAAMDEYGLLGDPGQIDGGAELGGGIEALDDLLGCGAFEASELGEGGGMEAGEEAGRRRKPPPAFPAAAAFPPEAQPPHGVRGFHDVFAGEAGAGKPKSKQHNPWSAEEAAALVEGVARCGGGKWAEIKKLGFSAIWGRTAVDLKDKWRNLVRIASLPKAEPAESPRAIDRRRELPAELLERVRFLMELHCSSGAAMGAAERPARPPRRFATLSGDTEAAPSPDSSS